MRILLPVPHVQYMTFILFAGVIILPEAFSDDPKNLYGEGNQAALPHNLQKPPYLKNHQHILDKFFKSHNIQPHAASPVAESKEKESHIFTRQNKLTSNKLKDAGAVHLLKAGRNGPAIQGLKANRNGPAIQGLKANRNGLTIRELKADENGQPIRAFNADENDQQIREFNADENVKPYTGSNGGNRKKWYIIGGVVIIILIIIMIIIVYCCCVKRMMKAGSKIKFAPPANPVVIPMRVPDAAQMTEILPEAGVAVAEINMADSERLQELSEQFPIMEPINDHLKEMGKEVLKPGVEVAIQPVIDNKFSEVATKNELAHSAQDTGVQLGEKSERNEVYNMVNSPTEHEVKKKLHAKELKEAVTKHEMDKVAKVEYRRKRYDSDSATADIHPGRRENYNRKESERGYDSDQSMHARAYAKHDQFMDSRNHEQYVKPRLQADQRMAYEHERRRTDYHSHPENFSQDYPHQHRRERPRKYDEYGGRDHYHGGGVDDPRQVMYNYDSIYDSRYNQKPPPGYDHPVLSGRHTSHSDYQNSTIKDTRYKEPFSRDVRHEISAVVANSSFSKNDYSRQYYEPPIRNNSFTIYTNPRSPKKEPVGYKESFPSTNMTARESLVIPLPRPDYQNRNEVPYFNAAPSNKPPVVRPKPVMQPIVKPREFKGPYGPEDLDEMNNPYTWSKGKARRIPLDDEE